ncbi:hypothetical protein H5U98_16410 [Mycolicibacterium boenickei]|uniref:Sensor histidine kinase n=1 Tax=Mycolicibacterium boenickei TaxID=146017 RepID=A0AAX2ZPQ8_9MYCO|nr:hypothetical protein [Mycolicibacterium boenickei]PEG58375.1 hypothetical protein CQY21_22970 [Mycolicibacterium boenickei]UNB97206.1 hypothetical protein H5U98_16410 [Mycolicibacterium boenickei]BBX92864.1 hypothetical protein MBOE_45130 [Mycolicibacterium boenickei]
MVTVPAFVWRSGPAGRALVIGAAVGVVLGVLAWLDSGFWVSGVIVLVVVGTCYGIWMARRMARYWPMSRQLSGADRVAVVRAARAGERIDDPRLVGAAREYRRGVHEAAESARPFRWLLPLVLVVAAASALWDAVFGSVGNVVVSVVYLAALVVELFWWPQRQAQLLARVDHACG